MCRFRTALFFILGIILIISGVIIFSFNYKLEGIITTFIGFGVIVLGAFYGTYIRFFASDSDKALKEKFTSEC